LQITFKFGKQKIKKTLVDKKCELDELNNNELRLILRKIMDGYILEFENNN